MVRTYNFFAGQKKKKQTRPAQVVLRKIPPERQAFQDSRWMNSIERQGKLIIYLSWSSSQRRGIRRPGRRVPFHRWFIGHWCPFVWWYPKNLPSIWLILSLGSASTTQTLTSSIPIWAGMEESTLFHQQKTLETAHYVTIKKGQKKDFRWVTDALDCEKRAGQSFFSVETLLKPDKKKITLVSNCHLSFQLFIDALIFFLCWRGGQWLRFCPARTVRQLVGTGRYLICMLKRSCHQDTARTREAFSLADCTRTGRPAGR